MVQVIPANVPEGTKLGELLAKNSQKGVTARSVVADKAYDSEANHRVIEEAGMKQEIPFRHRHKQAFSFRYRPRKDTFRCPAGKETVGKSSHRGGGYLYYFSQAHCSRCKRKESCLGDKETRKRVYFSERARNLLSCRPQLRELCDIARSWSASSQKPNAVARAGSSTLLGQVACNLKLMVRVLGT